MSDSSTTPTATALPYIHPLDDFYASSGKTLPKIERITGPEVPQPYRSLLVHENDMTPTLEKHFAAPIHLRILNRDQRGDYYFRQVILQLEQTDQPVEFGANKVSLMLFPARARQLILEERVPLGTILKQCEISHSTVAKAFFRVEADELIQQALNLRQPAILYGRRANILDPQKRPLSEIVEILPPIDDKPGRP